MGLVKLPLSLNILKVNNTFPMHVMSIFTFNETLYNLATGYTVISQVVPPGQTQITGYGNTANYPSGLYNWVTEYEHFPNQTLPYAYFNYTILNCWGTTQNGNTYANYNLYYNYVDGQLQYYGYTPSQQLPSCQPESQPWW